ncbi:hypothetical protein GCM10009678_20300 [Actinomadura kijaniata]|uniref:DUF1707 domain-containing protein n=1 Tax=Actinomadura namibiensis TaxID=182080 RepID=A0A7W3LIY0_ACTNM|nr:DUF1707 domain-containing protein [Actinomadura namibiensis]MBA8949012.1 hypothetical protein [Actinomadura namibiensis]
MSVDQRPAPRASDLDRDALLVRLHRAYAEGRLDEPELDERIGRALSARTHDDLDRIAADLPARRAVWTPEPGVSGRLQVACRSEVRRTGRWRCPETLAVVAHQGGCLLDLRDADLPARATVWVLAHRSTVRIVVPPGTRVEAGGAGVSTSVTAAPAWDGVTVRVRGLVHRGAVEVTDRPA